MRRRAGRAAAGEAAIARARLTAQLLTGPKPSSVEAVARHLVAMQAQDARGVRLAFRPRTEGLTAADVDRALANRSLVLTWLCRGTLHLVCAEDYGWLHALTAQTAATSNQTRLRQEGVSPAQAEKAMTLLERALASEGPLTRAQLKERLAAKGVPVAGQAMPHLLFLSSVRGLTVRGPMVEGEHAFVLVREWLRSPKRIPSRDEALAELARRYLAGHGPARDGDLAKWSGLPLRDVRRALTLVAKETTVLPSGEVVLEGRPVDGDLPPPLLLGAFDPLLHGWASREPVLGPEGGPAWGVVTSNGLFRPFALAEGSAVATWSMPDGRVEVKPFAPLGREVRRALDRDAEDVRRFMGNPTAAPRQGRSTGS
jgi:hypothetical protein